MRDVRLVRLALENERKFSPRNRKERSVHSQKRGERFRALRVCLLRVFVLSADKVGRRHGRVAENVATRPGEDADEERVHRVGRFV